MPLVTVMNRFWEDIVAGGYGPVLKRLMPVSSFPFKTSLCFSHIFLSFGGK